MGLLVAHPLVGAECSVSVLCAGAKEARVRAVLNLFKEYVEDAVEGAVKDSELREIVVALDWSFVVHQIGRVASLRGLVGTEVSVLDVTYGVVNSNVFVVFSRNHCIL